MMLRTRSEDPAFMSSPFSRRAYLCSIAAASGVMTFASDVLLSSVLLSIADFAFVLICIAAQFSISPHSLRTDCVLVGAGLANILVPNVTRRDPELNYFITSGIYCSFFVVWVAAGARVEVCAAGLLVYFLLTVGLCKSPMVFTLNCVMWCFALIGMFVAATSLAWWLFSLQRAQERLIEASYGSITVELPCGNILAACPRFHAIAGLEDARGKQLLDFLKLTDRADLESVLLSTTEGIFKPCLVTFESPGGNSFDAILVPYSGSATTVNVCIQPQGELRRQVDPEQVRSQTGFPRESMEPFADFGTDASSLQYTWRCQRCNATLHDWGQHTPENSDGISLLSLPRTVPRSATDPGPDRMLRRTLLQSGHRDLFLQALHRWRPHLYHEAQSTLQQLDRDATQLATQLRHLSEQRRRAELHDASRLVIHLQLVGLRVSSQFGVRGLGIAMCWPTVIHFVHGVEPLNQIQQVWPLLRLVSLPLPDIESHRDWDARMWTMMARRAPFPPTNW